MAASTNPKITCSYCSKSITQRHLFHHLHTSHHEEFWTPSNRASVEKAIARGYQGDVLLTIKGHESFLYYSPYSQRLYMKKAAAENDYKKNNEKRSTFSSLLSSLLSSSPAEKKVVTQVSEIAPENKTDLLALQKMIASLFDTVKKQRLVNEKLESKVEWLKGIVVEAKLKEEQDIDDYFDDPEIDETTLATDPVTKNDFKRLIGLTLKDFEDASKKIYEQTEAKPVPKMAEKLQVKPEPCPIPDNTPDICSTVSVSPEAVLKPEQSPYHKSSAEVVAPPTSQPNNLVSPDIQPLAPSTTPVSPQPPVVKKPPRQAVSYQQFVYREPQPQFPKILQTSKRLQTA